MEKFQPIIAGSQNDTSKNQSTTIAKGMLLLIIGCAVLLRQIPETRYLMPKTIFGVHSLLILLGIYNGIKHNFRNTTWLILLLIGTIIGFVNLGYVNAQNAVLYGVPVVLMGMGLMLIIKKR